MKFRFQKDIDELTQIRMQLAGSQKLDLDEVQELYYRKNYLEAEQAFGEDGDFEDEE